MVTTSETCALTVKVVADLRCVWAFSMSLNGVTQVLSEGHSGGFNDPSVVHSENGALAV